jgi:tetratricopeptide (TPR) repeat protein
MDEWKKLICRGNRDFEQGRLQAAGSSYQAALEEAERCLAQHAAEPGGAGRGCCYLDALAAVAAYVVTQHNLADLCVRLDRAEDAAAHLLAAHERLARIIDDASLPWSLRAAAVRNSTRARQAMLSFADEHAEAGLTCAIEQRITHMPSSPLLH